MSGESARRRVEVWRRGGEVWRRGGGEVGGVGRVGGEWLRPFHPFDEKNKSACNFVALFACTFVSGRVRGKWERWAGRVASG